MCWVPKFSEEVMDLHRQAQGGGAHSGTGKYFSGTSSPHPRNLVHGQMRGGTRL